MRLKRICRDPSAEEGTLLRNAAVFAQAASDAEGVEASVLAAVAALDAVRVPGSSEHIAALRRLRQMFSAGEHHRSATYPCTAQQCAHPDTCGTCNVPCSLWLPSDWPTFIQTDGYSAADAALRVLDENRTEKGDENGGSIRVLRLLAEALQLKS